ncbi:GerMN domain-containing protein [Oscillatoria sp. CS-180]|uniref:GerMN domain-containing protein n=1 Tax=Oscillatoria sp. CS-180 TaxID=3021720 RepID=UPI00232B2DC6|nr:GerMN domain-containing protein [Oscillatoria sp. CS-180]MDB9526836.1 GerMN domain-containing protein [Oscillatoria sp. CS-180]
MEDKSPRHRPSLGVILGLAAVILSAGSATAWLTWRSIAPKTPVVEFPEIEIEGEAIPEGVDAPTSPPVEVPDPPEADVTSPRQEATLYWLSSEGDAVALNSSSIELPAEASSSDTLELAFASLMDGPESAGAATGIPPETELLALSVESEGVYVNLSEDFTYGGGSASMIGRLAQVVYTATALEPESPVWLSVEGEPLTLLGGEGLEVRQPITRSDLESDFGVETLAD